MIEANGKSIDVNVSSAEPISQPVQTKSNLDSATQTFHSPNINTPSRRALNTFLERISFSERNS